MWFTALVTLLFKTLLASSLTLSVSSFSAGALWKEKWWRRRGRITGESRWRVAPRARIMTQECQKLCLCGNLEDLKSEGGCVTEPDSWASSSCYTCLVTPEIVPLLCCYVTTWSWWVSWLSWVSATVVTRCPRLRPPPQRGPTLGLNPNDFWDPVTFPPVPREVWYLNPRQKFLNKCWLGRLNFSWQTSIIIKPVNMLNISMLTLWAY